MISRFIRAIPLAIFISLAFHLLLVGSFSLFKHQPERPVQETIELTLIDEKNVPLKNLQVVDQVKKPLNDEVPENTKYLSRHNQRVVQPTKAKKTGAFINASGQSSVPEKKPVKAQAPPPTHLKKKSPQMARQFEDGTLPSLNDLSPKFSPSPTPTPESSAKNQPTPSGLASQTDDHLKGVDEGPQTLLNTREFVYFSYYQRIRVKIRQYWESKIRKKIRKIFAQGRSIASSKDRVTRVIIILDKHGALVKIQVIGKSGIHDLDDAAVEAFRAAEPFPNPPDGIVEEDGHIRIRWDFVLEA